jgi:hypothetical protein
MKWIGQHIWDLISRFRNDVYLDSPTAGGSDPDKFLGIDSDNKIIYRTGAEVFSDIGAAAGDITGVTITTDSGGGSAATDTSGSADFSILGSNGVGVTNSGTTIRVDAVPGEIDHDSLSNFAADEHFTQANITTVGTIGTGVWQGTAVASAYLDADTMHYSAQRQLTSHTYKADQDTTKTYVSLADADSEATTTTSVDLPLVAGVSGKLLKIFLRSNKNLNSHTLTWRLETQAGVNFATGPSVVGTQSGAGCQNTTMTTYDFTSSLDSGDNIIDAGDTVFLSLQSDTDFGGNVIYYITCLWEWDLS